LVAAVTALFAAPLTAAAGAEANLGALSLGQAMRHRVVVENKEEAAFTITNVETSCECVRILSFPQQVAPGGRGEVTVEVLAEKTGPFRYEVVVKTSDRLAPTQSFFLKVDVVTPPAAGSSSTVNGALRFQLSGRVLEAREQGLYLPVDDALAKMAKGEAFAFVDVREKRGFESASIPGSLNIAQHAVKSTGFLRARTVVLVDEGWGNPALESECRSLMKLGFAARILRGGVNAWQAAGRAFETGRAANPALAEVQPRDYLAARIFDDWLVVDAREKSEAAVSPLPEAVNVPFSSAPEFAESMAGLVARRGSYMRAMIVGVDGRENSPMRRALPAMPGCAMFFLAGGHQALREQLAMGVALAQSRTEHTGFLAAAGGGLMIRKPCGRCP
jgi:rhodanese-related sulfurtransferase